MKTLKTLLMIALLAVSCGPPPTPASGECTADSECETGLHCLSFDISNNGVCTASQTKICTLPCSKDADCASLKGPNGSAGFTCLGCPPLQATCGQLAH